MINNSLHLLRLAITQRVGCVVNPTASSKRGTRLLSTLNNIKDPYLTLQKGMDSSVCVNKEVFGYFAILIFNVRLTPHIVFIYWDVKKECVANFMFHSGRGYYKEFFNFIISTMDSIKKGDISSDNTKNTIFIPKNSVSVSNLNKLS